MDNKMLDVSIKVNLETFAYEFKMFDEEGKDVQVPLQLIVGILETVKGNIIFDSNM